MPHSRLEDRSQRRLLLTIRWALGRTELQSGLGTGSTQGSGPWRSSAYSPQHPSHLRFACSGGWEKHPLGVKTARPQQPRTHPSTLHPSAPTGGSGPLICGDQRPQTALYGPAPFVEDTKRKRPRPKWPRAFGKDGARDRARTGDPQLGKPTPTQAITPS